MVASDVLDGGLNRGDLSAGVTAGMLVCFVSRELPDLHPEVRSNRSDLGGLGLQGAVGDGSCGGDDLRRIEFVGVD